MTEPTVKPSARRRRLARPTKARPTPKMRRHRLWHAAGFGYRVTRQPTGGTDTKVVTLKEIPNVPVEGAERIEGWTGPVSRSPQTIIEPGQSANYKCSVVNFSQGCTTGWHTHSCDQLLIVTSGSGMVATEHERHAIVGGDGVQLKHGAV